LTIELDRARRETPGCANVAHLNNAGAGLMPQPVLDAITDHLRLEAEIGGYEAAAKNGAALGRFYDSAASLINCQAQEIAFVENATRAWDMAFYSLDFKPGDRILTAKAEYASNYMAYLQVARKTGAVVEVIDNDEHGQISIAALEAMVDDRVKLISITHVPTNGGLVNPAADVGRVARAAGVPYLLDACQSVGQMPIDVAAIGCDMLSATGRKYLRGPRGTGFLYVRGSMVDQLEPVFLDLHAAKWVARDRYEVAAGARRFENWESNFAGKIGLGVAMDYAQGWGLAAIRDRIFGMAHGLRARLMEIPGVSVNDLGVERCAIVSFHMVGREASMIAAAAADQAINVSVSNVASTRLDMEGRVPDDVVRASVHYYNSDEEIDRLCGVVKSCA
jgi:cysteine desulfurase/selenocysteine lyase